MVSCSLLIWAWKLSTWNLFYSRRQINQPVNTKETLAINSLFEIKWLVGIFLAFAIFLSSSKGTITKSTSGTINDTSLKTCKIKNRINNIFYFLIT